jgi:excisionase family DNA binding protein
MSLTEYLTPKEIAALLRVSPMTVYRMINDGEMRGIRVGGRSMRVARPDFEAYLAASAISTTIPRSES